MHSYIPILENDGRMPANGATKEWQVLTTAHPSYRRVRVDDTYADTFVDTALKAGR